jgi:hypothetical protein
MESRVMPPAIPTTADIMPVVKALKLRVNRTSKLGSDKITYSIEKWSGCTKRTQSREIASPAQLEKENLLLAYSYFTLLK